MFTRLLTIIVFSYSKGILFRIQKNTERRYMLLPIAILVVFLSPVRTAAQSVHYTFDDAGNRISKTFQYSSTRGGNSDFFSIEDCSSSLDSEVFLSVKHNVLTLFLVGFEEKTICDVQLSSADGKVIRQVRMTSPLTKLSIGSDANGAYILIVTLNGKKQTWKFLVD